MFFIWLSCQLNILVLSVARANDNNLDHWDVWSWLWSHRIYDKTKDSVLMHSIPINWDLNLNLVWFGLRSLVNFCILFSTNEHIFKETYTNKGSIYKSWKITLLLLLWEFSTIALFVPKAHKRIISIMPIGDPLSSTRQL